MYNDEQKRKYINYRLLNHYKETTVELIEKIFIATEKHEINNQKDISEFSLNEVITLLKNSNWKSPKTLKTNSSSLRYYYEWCLKEGLVNNTNPFSKKNINSTINSIIPKEKLNNKYFNKIEYLEMLDEIADVSNKFIAHAFYSGLTFEELTHLKIGDLDFDSNKIQLTAGREFIVDELFKCLMIETNDQEQYFADGIEKESRSKSFNYAESDYVIKSCGKNTLEPASQPYISSRMRIIKAQMDNEFISISTLYKNGMINYIKEQYSKRNIDVKTAFLYQINGKLYTYDKETQKYIDDFGSKMTVRFLRMETKDYLDCFVTETYDNVIVDLWEEFDQIAIRSINESIFQSRGFDIREDIGELWGVNDAEGDKKYHIKLLYLGNEYKAYFKKNNDDNSKMWLYWEHDFDIQLVKLFSHYIWNVNPMIRFEKINNKNYKINFITPDFLDVDIETETAENMQFDNEKGNEEGKTKYFYSKKYERDKNNRIEAIKIHGTICKCCGFDFQQTYGERGIGFIEIHHKNPLYNLDEEVSIYPKNDLVPVCSNCHRIIHRTKDKVLTVDEVRELLAINKKKYKLVK